MCISRPASIGACRTDRYTDIGVDATYQFTPDRPATILANASYVHERESFSATIPRRRLER